MIVCRKAHASEPLISWAICGQSMGTTSADVVKWADGELRKIYES